MPRGRGVRRPDQRECQDTGHGSDGGGHEACLGKAAGECLSSGGLEGGLQRFGHACSRPCYRLSENVSCAIRPPWRRAFHSSAPSAP